MYARTYPADFDKSTFDPLTYDPGTGVFTWNRPIGGKSVAGGVAGCKTRYGYWQLGIHGLSYMAHQVAWFLTTGAWPSGVIDHLNGDRLDNRIANLRDVDQATNLQNTRRARNTNTSGLLGAHRAGKYWQANICTNGVREHLGTFKTPEEASRVYLAAKELRHARAI